MLQEIFHQDKLYINMCKPKIKTRLCMFFMKSLLFVFVISEEELPSTCEEHQFYLLPPMLIGKLEELSFMPFVVIFPPLLDVVIVTHRPNFFFKGGLLLCLCRGIDDASPT